MTREDLKTVPTPETDSPESADATVVAGDAPEPLGIIRAAGEKDAGAAGGAGDGSVAGEPESDEDVEARLAYESLMRHRKARRRKKLIAGGVVGGLVVVALAAWGIMSAMSSQPAETPQLATMPLMRGEFSESVSATGTAQPLSAVVVTPEVDGIIESVNVSEGSTVSEGDVLLTIRNDELDKEVRSADIAVRSAKADVSSAQDAYNQTYKAYTTYVTTVDEAGNQTSERSASWGDVQKAQTAIDSAKLQLETAQEAYDAAVAKAAKRTVTAPTSGSVVEMNAQAGASLGASLGGSASQDPYGNSSGGSGSIIQIADLSQMTVKVQVNEVDISKIAEGQAARVTFSALPGTMLDAEVTRISTVASSGNDPYGGYGVVTYDVELLIPEPTAELKPGMTASVEIMMQHVPDTLTVSTSALMTDDGENYYLYVMTDPETQATERRDVTVVAQSATTAAIEGDVSDGDLVVLDPYAVAMGDMGSDGMGSGEMGDSTNGSVDGDMAVDGGEAPADDTAADAATDETDPATEDIPAEDASEPAGAEPEV